MWMKGILAFLPLIPVMLLLKTRGKKGDKKGGKCQRSKGQLWKEDEKGSHV